MRPSKRSKTSTKGVKQTPSRPVTSRTANIEKRAGSEEGEEIEQSNNLSESKYPENMEMKMMSDEEDVPDEADEKVTRPVPKPDYYATGGYSALKTFRGQVYSGMAVGASHTWNYDPGVWKETKEEPDMWRVDYQTTKRRARTAPKNSGCPVGEEYHWLIVAHQHVRKVDANTYDTHLKGSKYKLAHKAASSNSWSVPTVRGQREREIELLEDAKRRVLRLPPVSSAEKVKVERHERGQQKLDTMFAMAGSKSPPNETEKKRKRD